MASERDALDFRDSRALAEKRINRMWVGRKVTRLLPERPVVVVLLEPVWWRVWGNTRSEKLAQDVRGKIAKSPNIDLLVLVEGSSENMLAKKMNALPGTQIYMKG